MSVLRNKKVETLCYIRNSACVSLFAALTNTVFDMSADFNIMETRMKSE